MAQDDMASATPDAWPLCGYAPGFYSCKCHHCGRGFEGDKRAVECLECAAASARFLLSDASQKLRALSSHAEILEAISEAACGLLEVHEAMGAGQSYAARRLRAALTQGIAARSDETQDAARPERQEPDPEGDAPKSVTEDQPHERP